MINVAKAVSLKMGDVVLVCVTALMGRHKIQSRWENSKVCGGAAAPIQTYQYMWYVP